MLMVGITLPDRWSAQEIAATYPRMCNLYSLNKKRDMVARFFRVSHNRAAAFKPTGAIFPRHIAPVVRCADDVEREIVTMSWGFMLLQKGRDWLFTFTPDPSGGTKTVSMDGDGGKVWASLR